MPHPLVILYKFEIISTFLYLYAISGYGKEIIYKNEWMPNE